MKLADHPADGGGGAASGELFEGFSTPDPCRIPHPRECLPRRPGRASLWQPSRDRRDAGHRALPRSVLEGWSDPRLVAAAELGHVRINFNYKNIFTTAAGYGEKPRRAQYFEGPYELALFRLLETTATIVDYQFQPLQIQWRTTEGKKVVYTTDCIYATDAGEIVVEEVKANQAYFDDFDIHDQLKLFEAEIAKTGARFNRRSGRRLADPVFWRTVKDVFDDRRTAFDPGDVERVGEAIARHGGAAPLGCVVDALPVPSRQAQAMLNAMLVRRHVGLDLTRPLMGDTVVFTPTAPADPHALRTFLRRFAVPA